MRRGFGIDASVPLDVATVVAARVEESGYQSFWVNGSPHDAALAIVQAVLESTELDVGVGVFPLTKIGADELVNEVRDRGLPDDRLWLGVGSSRRPGALAEVRSAAETIGHELDSHVVTAAVGPKMMTLAGEVAEAVVLTWSLSDEVNRARGILEASAAAAKRPAPKIISFIRCGLMPQADAAIAERADAYDAIPHYHEVFERHGIAARDTVVEGASRKELLEGIEREESVLDIPVIRAIPAENTVEAICDLVLACAP